MVPIKPILEVAEDDPRVGDYTPPVRAETPSATSPAAETVPKPAPIIPLVHAPDDPGPDAVEAGERPETPHAGGWGKIFG